MEGLEQKVRLSIRSIPRGSLYIYKHIHLTVVLGSIWIYSTYLHYYHATEGQLPPYLLLLLFTIQVPSLGTVTVSSPTCNVPVVDTLQSKSQPLFKVHARRS